MENLSPSFAVYFYLRYLYAVPYTWGSALMLHDPAAPDFEPKGWADLMRPEVEGKISISDNPLGNITLAAIMATDAEVATEITHAQLNRAIEYLIEIKKRSRLVTTSWGELADAMARDDGGDRRPQAGSSRDLPL